MAEHGEEHAVHADGGLHAVGNVALAGLGIEVGELLSAQLLMVAEVEVGAGVDTLELLESEGEVELDVGGGVGVVGELLVVVEAVVLVSHSEYLMPLHAGFLPLLEPFHLGAGLAEEFHLHLLEFAHAEDELAGDDLVAEGLAYLGDAEGDLHAAGLLHVAVVYEDALGGLRTEIDGVGAFAGGAELGAEHEVELAHVGPVLGAGDGADDAAVEDYLLIFGQVVGVFGLNVTVVDLVPVGLFAEDVGVGLAEFGFVEAVSEALATLLNLLVDLLLDLGEIVLYENIGAIALLGVTVVDEGVIEGGNVPGRNPGAGMHEDGGIYAYYILVQANHCLPPVVLDIVLELHAQLAIVIHGSEAIINLAGREDKPIFLAVGYQNLEKFVLCHLSIVSNLTNLIIFHYLLKQRTHKWAGFHLRVGNGEFRGVHLHFSIHQDVDVDDAVVVDAGPVRSVLGLVRAAHPALYIFAYGQDGCRALTAAVADHAVQESRPGEAAGLGLDKVREGLVAAQDAVQEAEGRHYVGLARADVAAEGEIKFCHIYSNSGSIPRSTRASSESMLWSQTGSKVSSISHLVTPGVISTLC